MRRRGNLGWLSVLLSALLAVGCGEATGRVLGGKDSQSQDAGPQDPSLLRVGICGQGSAELELIDDMEDGNANVIQIAGRSQAWFAFNDESPGGVQDPAMDMFIFRMPNLDSPRGSSKRALRTVGTGFVNWGSGVGFDFVSKQPYDASRYAGIAFWARAGAEGEPNLKLRMGVNDQNTSPYGEVCDTDCQPDPPRANSNHDDGMCNESRGPCFDDAGVDLEPTLNSEWQFFSYPWSSLKPVNWSLKNLTSVVTEQIYGVRFQLAPGQAFDLWIDDVSFTCR